MARRRKWPEGTDGLVIEVDEIRADGIAAFKDPKRVRERIPNIKEAIDDKFPNLRPTEVPQGLRRLLKPVIEKLRSDNRRKAVGELLGVPENSPSKLATRLENAYRAETGEQHAYYNTIRLTSYASDLVEEVAHLLRQVIGPPEAVVGRQSVEQARAAALATVRKLLPNYGESDHDLLIDNLEYSMPAIKQAGRLIADEDFSIESFCRDLYFNAAPIFDSSIEGLTPTCRRLLNNLEETEPQAARTLEHIALLGSCVSEELLTVCLGDAVGIGSKHTSISRAVTRRALNVLRQESLIEVNGGYVTIPRVTKAILRGLVLEQKGEEVVTRLRSGILKLLRDVWQQRQFWSRLEFIHVASLIIAHWLCVERAALNTDDWDRPAREVARLIERLTGSFGVLSETRIAVSVAPGQRPAPSNRNDVSDKTLEWGSLISITPLIDPEFDDSDLLIIKVSCELDLNSLEPEVRESIEV